MTTSAMLTGARFLAPPSACGDELEQVDWAGTLAVHLHDEIYVGIRCSSAPLLDALARCLRHRVLEDVSAPAFYSLRLGTAGRRSTAPLHHLHEGGRAVLATRDVRRLVHGLAQHLNGQLPRDTSRLVVEAVPVDTPRGVLLVPQEILNMTRPSHRLLTGGGYRLADVPRVVLEPGCPHVVVPDPYTAADLTSFDLIPPGVPVHEPVLEPGRYPLAGWLLRVGPDRVGPLPAFEAAALIAHLLPPPYPDGAQSAIETILDTVVRIPTTGVTWSTGDELVAAVVTAGSR